MPHRLHDAIVDLFGWLSRAADRTLNNIAPLSVPCSTCAGMHHPGDKPC